jgi:site-specific DNA-methyltransferase (adenine-specific)
VTHPPDRPSLSIIEAENLAWLRGQEAESFELVYVDPPFNTGRERKLTRLRTERDDDGGDRTGFGGRKYRTRSLGTQTYDDRFDDYVGFLEPRMREAHRLLTAEGSLFVHVDPRESHYVKVMLDSIFGRDSFMNEIVWAYDYGGRSRRRWSAKHDVIFWYARNPRDYTYDYDAIDRVPYMAPKLVSAEKRARGKTPTDVWWQTIVSPTGKERTGYPTQKPKAILERIVRVHSKAGDRVLDFFAGSGTTGEAAWRNGRFAVLVDENPEAVGVMTERLAEAEPLVLKWPEEEDSGRVT